MAKKLTNQGAQGFADKYELCEGVTPVEYHGVLGKIDFLNTDIGTIDWWYANNYLDGLIRPKGLSDDATTPPTVEPTT